jgi:creatinine amidohydrolase
MMSYSIFSETMADMTYQQIETAAGEKQLVLFPIAVMEEHGPHLCTGTDTYLT